MEAKNQGSTAPAPGHGYRWRTLGPTSARARAHAMGLGKRSISSADRKRYPRTPQEKACSIFMCGRSRGLGQASRRTRVGSMGHGPGAGPVCGATVGTRLPIFRGATQQSPFHLMGGQCLAPSMGATRRVGCREIDRVCGRPGSHVFNRFLRVSAAAWRKGTPSPPTRTLPPVQPGTIFWGRCRRTGPRTAGALVDPSIRLARSSTHCKSKPSYSMCSPQHSPGAAELHPPCPGRRRRLCRAPATLSTSPDRLSVESSQRWAECGSLGTDSGRIAADPSKMVPGQGESRRVVGRRRRGRRSRRRALRSLSIP